MNARRERWGAKSFFKGCGHTTSTLSDVALRENLFAADLELPDAVLERLDGVTSLSVDLARHE
jgi:hypothetical protein